MLEKLHTNQHKADGTRKKVRHWSNIKNLTDFPMKTLRGDARLSFTGLESKRRRFKEDDKDNMDEATLSIKRAAPSVLWSSSMKRSENTDCGGDRGRGMEPKLQQSTLCTAAVLITSWFDSQVWLSGLPLCLLPNWRKNWKANSKSWQWMDLLH